jgi:2-methylcitrate dehydratase PrpD
MSTAAEQIARFAIGLESGGIPPAVHDAAKLHLLDTVGCALAAVATEDLAAAEVLTSQAGSPEATAVGCRRHLPAPSAAMVNGVAAHALDFDGTHEESMCHVSAVVAPAAIAAAEASGHAGDELLTAFVAGSEAVCRLGMAAPGHFHARGFHPTSVCGIFGATVAASRLFGLNAERTASAMGIAGSFAAGIFAYLADGSPTKPLHAGWAAQGGIQAARLSAAGATGPTAVLEARFGLYEAHTGSSPDLRSHLGDLGTVWQTPQIAFKAYPACHFLHACVDAAVDAFEGAGGVAPEEIAQVTVRVPETGADLVLEPPAEKFRPRTPYDAKFSLPFSVASRLVHGRLGVASYSADALGDSAVLSLAERFSHRVWSSGEAPAPLAGEVTIELANGRRHHTLVEHPLGSPSNPMTEENVTGKFRTNASTALDSVAVEHIIDGIQGLEGNVAVGSVLTPLIDASPRPDPSGIPPGKREPTGRR